MRTVHSVIKRTPRRYLAEIVMIDDFSNKGELLFSHTVLGPPEVSLISTEVQIY